MKKSKQAETARAADFEQWLHDQLTARGYDLSGPRSGGKTKFSEKSGISPSTVGRLLSGTRVTDMDVLALLAAALEVPLGEVLVRNGIISETELIAVQNPATGPRTLTPEQAADELGITDEPRRSLFLSMTHTLQRQQPPGEGNLAEH
ncbi:MULTISPECIES: helix-turn-helix domain-containing protein [Streptomyces]|uniref:helix-turn-helix domain-containing protein n=1 Tax=Streptomyces TaxID=1883 RepID=UPI002DDA0329|nr:helix-turn-helix domain-containing protein [Streptomyces phaeochromogenes]WRZ29963.1 helix-turn-helix domain-containing protein [Streptomyces phaeochromogenes]